jgi:hypothetical protein
LDKAFWAGIIERGWEVPDGFSAFGLAPELLADLGSTDPELRDKMCLQVLYHWIMAGRFSGDELRSIAEQLLGNLRAGIAAGENDQVFLRTFSAEALCFVLDNDGKKRVLSLETVKSIFAAGLNYMAAEQDWRGYDSSKGWAHSVAHTADLLLSVAEHPQAGVPELEGILAVIAAKLQTRTDYFLDDNEDFRLGAAVMAVLRRDLLPIDAIAAWVHELGGTERYKTWTPADRVWRHNATSFLTAFHVMLTYQDIPEPTREAVLSAVRAALKSYQPWFV